MRQRREKMLKTSLIVFVIVAAALLTTSSGSASIPQVGAGRTAEVESSAIGEQPGDEVREEFQQSYPLSANGRVGLENLNGNV
ncbi:MAG: hypothetical protein ACRD8U_23930, partial [Pyrinomonadaceae bacterium]